MRGGPQRQYNLDDYHRIEQASTIRHEFFDGEIFAMAGGSVAHNHISANVLAALRGTPPRLAWLGHMSSAGLRQIRSPVITIAIKGSPVILAKPVLLLRCHLR